MDYKVAHVLFRNLEIITQKDIKTTHNPKFRNNKY